MKFDKEKFINWVREYADYEDLKTKASFCFEGWQIRDPNTFFKKSREIVGLVDDVIVLVEKFSRDVDCLSSKEKQKAAKEFLDSLIILNPFLEWVDNIVIDCLIAAVVEAKNKNLGKEWFSDE